jgi:hypothetical protein
MDAPTPRQPGCSSCGHEAHTFLPCDWCLCAPPPAPGIYADPWPPYLGD